jgi:hypothetical protein
MLHIARLVLDLALAVGAFLEMRLEEKIFEFFVVFASGWLLERIIFEVPDVLLPQLYGTVDCFGVGYYNTVDLAHDRMPVRVYRL